MSAIISRDEFYALMKKQSGQSVNFEKQKREYLKGVEAIESGEFDNVVPKDWYSYFCKKAKQYGLCYVSSKNSKMKELSVFKSLMINYSSPLIKAMIDYLWDSNHKLVENKYEINIFMLSKGYLNVLVPCAEKWLKGDRNYCSECDPRLRIESNKKLDEGGVWIAGVRIC